MIKVVRRDNAEQQNREDKKREKFDPAISLMTSCTPFTIGSLGTRIYIERDFMNEL